MQSSVCQAATTSDGALVAGVLALPPALANRIAATAEALSAPDFCGQFPTDCRLVVQALCRASLLGRVQRQVARAAPLCVLVDMAALQRRPGALAPCLLWLLQKLPNLRAVRFAEGGTGSMVSTEELAMLLPLAAADPSAAASLRHVGVYTTQLGQLLTPGVLAPLTHLRSLQLRWFSTVDLAGLPPSLRSLELRLPGVEFNTDYLLRAHAAGQPMEAAQAQLNELYQQWGRMQPLATVPRHALKELTIDADGMALLGDVPLSASQLFGAAEVVRLLRADTLQLLLPLPGQCRPWNKLLRRARAGGIANPNLRAELGSFALLAAFQSAAGLKTAQLCAKRWVLQLPLLTPPALAGGGDQPVPVIVHPDDMLWFVNQALSGALSQLGRLRTTGSKVADGELQLRLRRSRVGAATIHSCTLVGGTLGAVFGAAGMFSGLLSGFGILYALLHPDEYEQARQAGDLPPLWHWLGSAAASLTLFHALEWNRLEDLLLRHT